MFGLEISSVPTVLPTLETVLRTDFKQLQWIMNAYTLACTTVLMATGTLADRFGRKRVYVVSIVIFALTSLMCGLAQSAPVLIAARFQQGICRVGNHLRHRPRLWSDHWRDDRCGGQLAVGVPRPRAGVGCGVGARLCRRAGIP
jgi:hypothetical protein